MDQEDVAGELQRGIPGLTVSSGYRTPEYQADMRRRGYKPADDSHHLDGSSLDLVPPRGMSIRALAAAVKLLKPNVVTYPEGDHLHTTFPGWYGAPVLGNARSWGFANPNAANSEGMFARR